MITLPPGLAAKFHVAKLLEPDDSYEHHCPMVPSLARSKPLRVVFIPSRAGSWLLYRGPTRELIVYCPWCSVKLPDIGEFKCTCGADTIVDRHGYHEIIRREVFDDFNGRDVSLRVRARIVEFIHEDSCPARGLRTRGRA